MQLVSSCFCIFVSFLTLSPSRQVLIFFQFTWQNITITCYYPVTAACSHNSFSVPGLNPQEREHQLEAGRVVCTHSLPEKERVAYRLGRYPERSHSQYQVEYLPCQYSKSINVSTICERPIVICLVAKSVLFALENN